jgi:folate-binding protein YgfZ
MDTPLQIALRESHVAAARPHIIVEYRGGSTAARFADPQTELSALRTNCAVYDLGFRVQISLTGKDRVRWLNGMVSNKIRDLAPDHGVYAFLLNPQGRILGDLHAYNRGESILVETDRSQLEAVLAIFKRYIIMDQVTVTSLADTLTALGVAGPKSLAVLRAAGIEIPQLLPLQLSVPRCTCQCDCLECTVIRTEDGGEDAGYESYEIWLAPQSVKQAWDALIAAGATPIGSEALESERILSGVPLYGVDIRERDLPQETGQMRALNFNKGCYIGQEIVERIRSRGNVHRTFTRFVSGTRGEIAPGAKVSVAEKEAGEVTSVTSGGDGRTVALGYIRREHSAGNQEVTISGVKAHVVPLRQAEVAPSTPEIGLAQPQPQAR